MNEKKILKDYIEETLEKSMFSSRWFMAPVYIVLSISLAVIMLKVVQEFLHYIPLFHHQFYKSHKKIEYKAIYER